MKSSSDPDRLSMIAGSVAVVSQSIRATQINRYARHDEKVGEHRSAQLSVTTQHGERVRMKALMKQSSIHDRPIILRGIRMLHVVVMLRVHHWKIRAFQLPSLLCIIATQVQRMVKTIFRSYYYQCFGQFLVSALRTENTSVHGTS